jgi:hypothetical protein
VAQRCNGDYSCRVRFEGARNDDEARRRPRGQQRGSYGRVADACTSSRPTALATPAVSARLLARSPDQYEPLPGTQDSDPGNGSY